MNMKRFLTAVLASAMRLIGVQSHAQQFVVGGGFTQMSLGGSASEPWDISLQGFIVGLSTEIEFSAIDNLTFEPGVYLSHYGKTFETSLITSRSYRANYIFVPANIKYTFDLANDFTLSAYTGPRLSFGFAGNAFSKSRLGLRNFDAQWGFGVGLCYFDAVEVRLGYDLGLNSAIKKDSNIAKAAELTRGDGNLKVRRNMFHVGVSFNIF